ncbi:hybrid sensor histidine kinase/response regulator [Leeia oryzae]|uniref:hybrid sensor histidine kinase/response regulator n=1 Tax=Leeia oryzae TaxID=356662 RepID=UPI000381DA2B|nr:Hpt domain-containing protein [Leeia oryzae]
MSTVDFDVGSLIWVKAEIDNAVGLARQHVQQYAANTTDETQLKFAQTHLHQASGALEMVGLSGLTAFAHAIEGLLGALPATTDSDVFALIDKALAQVSDYISALIDGAPNTTLRLFDTYRALFEARGSEQYAASDLFYPDLLVSLPDFLKSAVPTDDGGKAQSRLLRTRYQTGLIAYIRSNAADALAHLAVPLMELARVQPSSAQRAFWWVASAMVEAMAGDAQLGQMGKPLLTKLDQQMRRLVEGTPKAPENLLRQMLYLVAVSASESPTVLDVKETYGLSDLLPGNAQAPAVAVLSAQALRALRASIEQAKDVWTRITTQQPDRLPLFLQQLEQLSSQHQAAGLAELSSLFDGIAGFVRQLPETRVPHESDAMNVATALLLAETALEQYPKWTEDLPAQIQHAIARINGSTAEAPLLDQISQQAQEKLLLAQVAHEITGNLQQIEQQLDGFFRDTSQRNVLVSVASLMHQVDGAFMMLGAEAGSQLIRLAAQRTQPWRDPQSEPHQTELEQVAEMLSALGFYLEALQSQRADAAAILAPFLSAAAVETPAATVPTPAEPAEPAPELAWPDEEQTFVAAPVADTSQDSEIEEIQLAPVPEPMPEPVVSAPLASVPAADAPVDEASDADLLDIYLEEATEILGTLSQHVANCRVSPQDRDSLTTIRRSFHTLKGSGRMVGLTHLGEAAWAIEQVMNRWLQEDRPAQPALLDLIDFACHDFQRWISALSAEGSAVVDAGPLLALAEAFKHWQEGPLPEVPVVAEAAAPTEALSAVFDELPSLDLDDELAEPAPMVVEESPALDFELPDIELPDIELTDLDVAEPVAEITTVPEIEEPASAVPEEVLPSEYVIGDVTISTTLYGIFTSEADKHLATLDEQLNTLSSGGGIQPEFTHAAHTLRGIGNTTGFTPVGNLSEALEQYLLARQATLHTADDDTFALIAETIATLHEMVACIEDKQPPQPAADLIARLHAPLDTPHITLEQQLISEEQEAEPVEQDAEWGDELASLLVDLDDVALLDGVTPEPVPDISPDAALPAEAPPEVAPEALPEVPDVLDMPVNDLLVHLDEINQTLAAANAVAAAEDAAWNIDLPLALTEPDDEQTIQTDAAAELTLDLTDEAATDQPLAGWETPADAGTASSSAEELAPLDLSGMTADDLEQLPIETMLQQAILERAEIPEPAPISEIATAEDVVISPAQEIEIQAQDDVDEQLLPVFLEEAEELLPEIGDALRAWRADPAATEPGQQLLRTLHTLKGSARMAGAMRLGELTHSMETRVQQAVQVGLLDDALFDAFESDLDLLLQYRDMLTGKEDAVEASTSDTVAGTAAVATDVAAGAGEATEAQATLRVKADLIDRLVNEAGEVSIARARIDAEVRNLKQSLLELTDNVNRMRGQLRELEIQAESQMQSRLSTLHEGDDAFDPLEFDRFTRLQELTRLLAESVNDVATVQHNLLKNVDDSEAALLAQARQTRDLQQSLMRIRTVPLSTLTDRLYRIVRQTAKDLGKKVNLEIKGARLEIDRSVLEKMTSPFEHLLRNAVDHGLESREQRLALGKPEIGEILIEARQEGNEMILTLSDDGAGIDVARVREKAVEQGLIQPGDKRPDSELLGLIFRAGFSTAETLTQVSGRGIGMDVVKSEIESLGGRVNVTSTPGAGSMFTMRLPLTLAVTQTVLVTVGAHQYAIPSGLVEQVQELKVDPLNKAYAEKAIEWQGQSYPFWYLPRLLGDEETLPELMRYNTVLLLKSANRRVAIHVDKLTRNQEVVVKNIGPQLARVIGVAGATVLGSGQIVLIINPVELMAHADRLGHLVDQSENVKEAVVVQHLPHILVVDDSLTVRKITGRLLERQGYTVMTAKDGVDALQQVGDYKPDVMLVDIEMPRMDGFELTRNIRNNPATKDIPIIMISSRTAEKHRKVASDLGVNQFLGKPYQEDELLGHIRHYLEEKQLAVE